MLGEVLQSVLATVRRVGEEIGGDGKYFCIAAVSNGKLYVALRNASRVLEIDPESATVRQVGEGMLPWAYMFDRLAARIWVRCVLGADDLYEKAGSAHVSLREQSDCQGHLEDAGLV